MSLDDAEVISDAAVGGERMAFLFENLDVYKKSLKFVEAVDELLDKAKGKIPYARQDQLARASLSVPLNIAEGNGRTK